MKTRDEILAEMTAEPCPNCQQSLSYHEASTNRDRCPKCGTPVVWAWTVYPPSKHGHWERRNPQCLIPKVEMVDWMNRQIDSAANRWDWSSLPQDFELQAVRRAFSEIRPHFAKNEIRQRIAASKATTFSELREAINDGD